MAVTAVYQLADGELVSVGTTVADPLPAGLGSVVLSDPDWEALRDGTGRWDPPTLTVVAVPPDITITITESLLTKANTALTLNGDYLAIPSPDNTEVRDHVNLMTREVNGLIRLLTGEVFGQRNNLEDETGT